MTRGENGRIIDLERMFVVDLPTDKVGSKGTMTANLVEISNQLRGAITNAVLTWSVMPILAAAIGYGELRIMFHAGQLRDVRVELGGMKDQIASPPKLQ